MGKISERYDARGGATYPSLPNKKPPPQENRKQEHKKEERSSKNSCQYCWKIGLLPPGRNCPVYAQQCLKCGKYNHYATCCRSGSDKIQEQSKESRKEKVNTDASSESDCEYLYQTARHVLHRAQKLRSGSTPDTVLIRIGDIEVPVEPDSERSVKVMDEYQFRALKHRSKEIGELDPSTDILKTLQFDLVVKGEFHTTIRIKNRGAKVSS